MTGIVSALDVSGLPSGLTFGLETAAAVMSIAVSMALWAVGRAVWAYPCSGMACGVVVTDVGTTGTAGVALATDAAFASVADAFWSVTGVAASVVESRDAT